MPVTGRPVFRTAPGSIGDNVLATISVAGRVAGELKPSVSLSDSYRLVPRNESLLGTVTQLQAEVRPYSLDLSTPLRGATLEGQFSSVVSLVHYEGYDPLEISEIAKTEEAPSTVIFWVRNGSVGGLYLVKLRFVTGSGSVISYGLRVRIIG